MNGTDAVGRDSTPWTHYPLSMTPRNLFFGGRFSPYLSLLWELIETQREREGGDEPTKSHQIRGTRTKKQQAMSQDFEKKQADKVFHQGKKLTEQDK